MTNFPRETGFRQTLTDIQRRLYALERRVSDNLPTLDYGTVQVTLSSANSATNAVVFAQEFDSAPEIYVSIVTSRTDIFAKAENVTVTGFDAGVNHRDNGTTISATATVKWIALGD